MFASKIGICDIKKKRMLKMTDNKGNMSIDWSNMIQFTAVNADGSLEFATIQGKRVVTFTIRV